MNYSVDWDGPGEREREMPDTFDDLRERVEDWEADEHTLHDGNDMILIRDLWRAVQDARAEANAWKHANAMVPLTAEELAEAMKVATAEDALVARGVALTIIESLGPLYRQSKP
jgi:hypothetical protein